LCTTPHTSTTAHDGNEGRNAEGKEGWREPGIEKRRKRSLKEEGKT
jgi:hypothetical protein